MTYFLGGFFSCLIVLGIARVIILIIEAIGGERDTLRLVLPILTILCAIIISMAGKDYMATGIILAIAGIIWLVYNLMENMLMDFLESLPFAVIAIGTFIFMASLVRKGVGSGVALGFIITIAGIAWRIIDSILKKKKEREKAEEEKRIQEFEAQKKREWETETERLKQTALQGDVNAQYQIGERFRSNDNLGEAKKWYKMAADSGHKEAKAFLDDEAVKQKAREEAEKAVELKKKVLEFMKCHHDGIVNFNQGDYDSAIVDFDKAIAWLPDAAGGYSCRGNAYSKKGDNDKAIADYDKAIGDYGKAIADYNKAIKFNPKLEEAYSALVEAYFNRGDLYREKEDNDLAIADFSKIIEELNPANVNGYVCRGATYVIKGEYKHAHADFEQALRIDPDNTDAQVGLEFLKGKEES